MTKYVWDPTESYIEARAIVGTFTDDDLASVPKEYRVVVHAIAHTMHQDWWDIHVLTDTEPGDAYPNSCAHAANIAPAQGQQVLALLTEAFEIARRWQENPETIQQDCLERKPDE